MPTNPNAATLLGYTPQANTSAGTLMPSSLQQWQHDAANGWANAYANGSLQAGAGSLFDNAVWQQIGGGQLLNPGEAGAGLYSPQTYDLLYQYAGHVAATWSSLPPEQRVGLSDPTQLPNASATLDTTDRNNLAQAQNAEMNRLNALAVANLQESGMNARNAADIAARMSIAQLQEAGANSRNAATIAAQLQQTQIESADRRYVAELGAQVNREDIASRERISTADRTSREGIATADRQEQAREFDLNITETRRQFNGDLMFRLLDRGVELMKNPVDWVAYQYYLENMNIPLTAMTVASAAAVFGAVPPTGPSSVGPVIGGPAVIDGDNSFAEQVGITNAGPVSMSEAVAANPGGTVMPMAAPYSAQATVDNAGGAEVVDEQLAQARSTDLPAELGNDSAFVTTALRQADEIIRTSRARTLASQAGLGIGPDGQSMVPPAIPGADGGMTRKSRLDAAANPGMTSSMATNPVDAIMTPTPASGGALTATTPGVPPALPGAVTADPTGMTPPAIPAATNTAGAVPGTTGGPYTGNEGATVGQAAAGAPVATGAGGTPGGTAGATDPVGQLMAQLSQTTGIPLQTLQQLFPSNLMTPLYGDNAIQNSPIIQSLQTGGNQGMSSYNTGAQQPVGGLQPLRGGQDYNATTFLNATPGQQGLLQGAAQAGKGTTTPQYWPDFMKQMLGAAPLTNLESGSSGRRRFG